MKKFLSITVVSSMMLVFAGHAYAVSIFNPLGEGITIQQFAGNVIQAVLGIVGAIALAMVTYGGFLYLTSAGNTEKVQKGRTIFIWSFFGLLVIFGSYAVTSSLLGTVTGQPVNQGAALGPQNGCEERGANWACINTFCSAETPLDEYSSCIAQFTQTNSDLYVTCVPGGPLCGSPTELCCNIR